MTANKPTNYSDTHTLSHAYVLACRYEYTHLVKWLMTYRVAKSFRQIPNGFQGQSGTMNANYARLASVQT